jgi:hypothetical protein
MSISIVLMTAIMGFLLPAATTLNYAQSVQDELKRLRNSVASALPSEWHVVGASSNESLWSRVDALREKYKGYKIDLSGPLITTQEIPKGEQKVKKTTSSLGAVLFLIPVWRGISQAEIDKDFRTGWETKKLLSENQGVQQPPPQDSRQSATAYGWNGQYLLICDGFCGAAVLERVAKQLNIPKR